MINLPPDTSPHHASPVDIIEPLLSKHVKERFYFDIEVHKKIIIQYIIL